MLNSCTLVGVLSAAPELRYTANGAAVANLRINTWTEYTDRASGEIRRRDDYHRIVVWGANAEQAAGIAEGALVAVAGRVQTRKWQDDGGADRYITEIVADGVQLYDVEPAPRPAQPSQAQRAQPPSQGARDYRERSGGQVGGQARRPAAPPEPELNDDIPF